MKTLLVALILILSTAVVADVLSSEQNEALKKAHIQCIQKYHHTAVLKGEHSFLTLGKLEILGQETSQTNYVSSVYETEKEFSCYTETKKGKLYLFTNKRMSETKQEKILVMNTFNALTIAEKEYTLNYNTIFQTKLGDYQGCTISVKTDLPHKEAVTKLVLGYGQEFYAAFIEFLKGNTKPTIISRLQLGLEILTGNWTESSRGIVTQNFSWSVSAGNVQQFGDGTVVQFHLWIGGGIGSIRHEIMAGYLVITGLWGSMHGTGIIYMQH